MRHDSLQHILYNIKSSTYSLENNIPLSKQLGKCIFMLSIGELITKRTGFYGNESESQGMCVDLLMQQQAWFGACSRAWGRCESMALGPDMAGCTEGPCSSTASAAVLLSLYMGEAWEQSSVTSTGLRHLAVWTWPPDIWRIAILDCLVSGDLRIDFGNLCLAAIPAAGRRRSFWTYRRNWWLPCREVGATVSCELISGR